MSYGLREAGINVLAGIDNEEDCRKTYESNISGAQFIKHDISTLTRLELQRRLDLQIGDPNLIFAGCSPCQFWSKIRTNKTKSEKTAFLLKRFQKFIKYFLPGFVVIENVPGLYKRKSISILPEFIDFLKRHKYELEEGVVNTHHYGVPQNRMRYLLIATRNSTNVTLPPPNRDLVLNVSDFIGIKNGFPSISAGHRDDTEDRHTCCALSKDNLRRIRLTPASGGDRTAWRDEPDLQIPAYKDKNSIFRDVYGRMYWDRPAPTITTRFNSLSNGRFGHPDEDRAISLREGATLQTFPRHFVFHGNNINHVARQIGNAVPPELAKRIGAHIINLSTYGENQNQGKGGGHARTAADSRHSERH